MMPGRTGGVFVGGWLRWEPGSSSVETLVSFVEVTLLVGLCIVIPLFVSSVTGSCVVYGLRWGIGFKTCCDAIFGECRFL
jgi:hypothetical protein